MRQLWILILALVAGAGPAVAGSPLTLRQALQTARENALDVRAAEARLEAARARVRQAKGFRLPVVTLEETYIRTDSPAEAFALKLNQERFSFADFMASDPNQPEPLATSITRLEVRVPIYTGGELSGRIEQAHHAADSAASKRAWAADQAALTAGEAYVMLAQAREYVELLDRSRETVEAHVRMARAYVDEGMIVASELLRARVELSRIEDLLLEAQGHARVAEANLAFALAVQQGSSFELAPLPLPDEPKGDLTEWLEAARGRGDLEAARAVLRAGELEERVVRASFLPRLGVVARGDLVDDQPFGSHGDSTAIIAVAGINIFAGGSDRAALTAARWEVEAGRRDVDRFEEGIQLQVRQAFEEARTAVARRGTAAAAVEAASETARINRERFASGVVKMIDVLDATTALREAETRELVARGSATAALLRLAVVAGRPPESVVE